MAQFFFVSLAFASSIMPIYLKKVKKIKKVEKNISRPTQIVVEVPNNPFEKKKIPKIPI